MGNTVFRRNELSPMCPEWTDNERDPRRRINDRRGRQLVADAVRCYCGDYDAEGTTEAGRLIVDGPTDLPEGTKIELLPLDPGDWLDDEDRAALHQALRDSDQ